VAVNEYDIKRFAEVLAIPAEIEGMKKDYLPPMMKVSLHKHLKN